LTRITNQYLISRGQFAVNRAAVRVLSKVADHLGLDIEGDLAEVVHLLDDRLELEEG